MSTGAALVIAYVLVSLATQVSLGFYSPLALALVVLGLGALVAAYAWVVRGGRFDDTRPAVPWFAGGLVVLLLAGLTQPAGLFTSVIYDLPWRIWLIALALLVGAAYQLFRRGVRKFRLAVFLVAVVVAFGFRIWMPIASPSPKIDVFTDSQQSAANLLAGKNPYTTQIADVYAGQTKLNISTVYPYLPADLYLQTISYRLTGDVRYVYILAEALAAFALWQLARKRWGASIAELIVLLFLYQPRGLFVLEQAWIDPLILGFFGLYLMLREKGKPSLAAAAFGYLVFLKEYMVFAFLQWLVLEREWKRPAIALGVGALTIVPFAAAEFGRLGARGSLYTGGEFRPDSLTIFAWLSAKFGITPPPGSAIAVGLLVAVAAFVVQRRIASLRTFLFSVTITLGTMFLFGTNTFCNWWYLVGGMTLFTLAVGGTRPATLRPDASYDEEFGSV